jgi:CheY-like chemotaxis protein
VLLDLSLPGLEPHAVLMLFRSSGVQFAPVRVFACTALRDARTQTLAELFDGFIEKPIRWERLHETLRRALG